MKFLLRVLVFALLVAIATMAWMVYDGLNDSHGTANYAVVFASPTADVQSSSVLQQQLDEAIRLYQSKIVAQIIVSSVGAAQGSNEPRIGGAISQYLMARGVPGSQVLADDSSTTMDAAARDVATYLKQGGNQSVMIVAPYYEVTRNKLALWRAGVEQVLQRHVGEMRTQDIVPAGRALGESCVRVVQDDVEPEVQKLVVQANAQGHKLMQSSSPETSATAGSSDTPGSPVSASVPVVTDVPTFTDGQTVVATGIASLEIPRDWSQRIIPPILDPVWAAPGASGQFSSCLMLLKTDHPGPLSEFPPEVEDGLRRKFGNVTELERGSFTTSSGAEGLRLVTTMNVREKAAEAVLYIFEAAQDKKIVLTGLCLTQDAPGMIPTFDACAKTIR